MYLVTDYCATRSIIRNIRNLGENCQTVHHTDTHPFVDTDDFIAEFDGLVLSGGEDIHPKFYKQTNTSSYPGSGQRDEFELWLLERFALAGKKILGICRGHQLINVFFGGDLHQDIHQAGFHHGGGHTLTLMEFGNELFNGLEILNTNSLHHQGVNRIAKGFTSIAVHKDGLVEGIYSEEYKALGVQWHPEMMEGSEEVFKWLVK